MKLSVMLISIAANSKIDAIKVLQKDEKGYLNINEFEIKQEED